MFTRPQGIAIENRSHEACGIDWPASLLVASWRAGPAGRSITKAVLQIGSKLSPSPKTVALLGSLILSALLTAAALRLPDQQWLAWISFLPLFVVVRSLGPLPAALAGGFWGGCLYLFCSAGPTPVFDIAAPAIGPSAGLLALLILIPGVCVGLAARPARAIGYKLLMLALGWTLVEAVLHLYNHFGPHEGLLTSSQSEGPQLHWLARLLGYVGSAFLVACANASLVGIVSGARVSLPPWPLLGGSPAVIAWLPSQVVLAIESWTLRQAHPRAPPL